MEWVWYGIQTAGTDKSPPRAHARLVTDTGLSETPLCGIRYQWTDEQPTRGRCRRCEDITQVKPKPRRVRPT